MASHAARTLWNLTSKHAANQDAVRDAGAIPPLVQLLTAPDTIKVGCSLPQSLGMHLQV